MDKKQLDYFMKVKKKLEDTNCILLEKSYKKAKELWHYQCACGEECYRKPSDFMKDKLITCKKCGIKRTKEHQTLKLEDVEKYFNDEEEFLIKSYIKKYGKSNRTFCEFKCKEGHLNKMPFYSYKSGNRCKECSLKEASLRYKMTIEQVRNIFKEQNCELISKEYIDWNTPLEYKCSCGNISKSNVGSIKKGIKCGCQRHKGKDAWNWNPNLTEEDRLRMRSYPEYIQWIKDVYVRDDYTCQCCFARGVRLASHHIYGYSEYRDLRTNIKNGITLCEKCHKEFHSFYGVKGFDESDLNEYIKEIQKTFFGKVITKVKSNLFKI